ncbi:rolling circle replication-associated protein [Dethiobacter alkaliphilus]|uniref:Replication-associated protein ORF2/G2P domain-containing protein n=1 Tax=Dethiobacter alkaliphilus AHT 1 TaxID=555088 RepID=C0GET5_DETAL|nr:hypothetical protein [Dethiobacter alkaliphilus]EEG78117.1 hypothetical protein DealDRAFT_0994 [Dethiobacter alkaliphilus AHT 1]
MANKRRTTAYWLTLSYKIEPTGDIKKQTKAHLKALMASLRKQGRANQWAYKIICCPSITDPRTKRVKRLHIHLLIEGNPGATIAQYIEKYWSGKTVQRNGKGYGLANYGKCNQSTAGYISYMQEQAIYTWEQTEGELPQERETFESQAPAIIREAGKLSEVYRSLTDTNQLTVETMEKIEQLIEKVKEPEPQKPLRGLFSIPQEQDPSPIINSPVWANMVVWNDFDRGSPLSLRL